MAVGAVVASPHEALHVGREFLHYLEMHPGTPLLVILGMAVVLVVIAKL